MPASTALGVEMTNAHGDAPTSTAIARRNASAKVMSEKVISTKMIVGTLAKTIGV